MTSLFKIFKKFDGELRFKDGTHVPLPKIVNFIKKYLGMFVNASRLAKVHFKIQFQITYTDEAKFLFLFLDVNSIKKREIKIWVERKLSSLLIFLLSGSEEKAIKCGYFS